MHKAIYLAAVVLIAPSLSSAQGTLDQPECLTALKSVEAERHVPAQLLQAIAIVESGRIDPVSARVVAWPWTINVDGVGFFYPTKQDAIDAVRKALAVGRHHFVDVGCMQINLQYHPNAFATLDDAFDPHSNVEYGAHFLLALHQQFGAWPQAIAAYHSQSPDLGAVYWNRVMVGWSLASRFTNGKPLPVSGSIVDGHAAVPGIDTNMTPELARQVAETEQDHRRIMAGSSLNAKLGAGGSGDGNDASAGRGANRRSARFQGARIARAQ